MHRQYCTLFDKNYLSKGLVLHESLLKQSSEPFTLHVLAMDEQTSTMLSDFNLPYLNVMPLQTFERALDLKPVRESRTHQEWCWTLASVLLNYLVPWSKEVAYIDSDCFFFQDPKIIFDEIGDRSIGITPHRLIPSRKHLEETNGKFNVGWVSIKNTDTGRIVASNWAHDCRVWCYNRVEPGRFGDQKYLDRWPGERGDECCVVENIGVNVAPWNLANWRVTEGPKVDGVDVVFLHAHEYVSPQNLTKYKLRDEDLKFIYAPYVSAWIRATMKIQDAETAKAKRREQLELQAERV